MSAYADMEELIRIGAYKMGSDAEVDEAIRLRGPLEAFLRQAKEERPRWPRDRRVRRFLGRLETKH